MKFLLFFLLILFSNVAIASKLDVILTGFSINADYKDLERSAFYTNKLLNRFKGSQNIIDETLQDVIFSNEFDNFNILNSTAQLSDETTKIAISIFLDQELFEEFKLPEDDCKKIKISNCHIYNINNYYQIIFFDFEKMTFLKAIPFQSIYISDPLPKLSDDEKVDLLIKSYENGNWLTNTPENKNSKSSMSSFINILKETQINKFYDAYVGINPNPSGFKVDKEKVKSLIPAYIYNNIHLLKRHVANTFLGELALKHNVVIVPYYEGVAIGNKIRGKYANRTEAYEIEIPEPDFFIDVNIRGFVKKKYKEDENVKDLTWYIYGSGINLKFYEPLLDKVYLDIKMTKADFKKIPDILDLNQTNEFVNIINLTYKPLAIEFSNILSSDFKSKNDKKWLEKITKKSTKKEEIIEFKKFIDKIKSSK